MVKARKGDRIIYDNKQFVVKDYNPTLDCVKLTHVNLYERFEIVTKQVWISVELIRRDVQYYREKRFKKLLDGKKEI